MAFQQDRTMVLASLIGLSSCTIFYAMNSTLNHITGPALILHPPPTTNTANNLYIVSTENMPASAASHLCRQWREVLAKGGKVGVASAAVSGISLSYAAYLCPSASMQRRLHVTAAALAVAVVPFTFWKMISINQQIEQRANTADEAIKTGNLKEGSTEKQEFINLLKRWTVYSRIRASMTIVAAGCVIGALVV